MTIDHFLLVWIMLS